MMKVLAFAASNNRGSINQKLVIYVAKQMKRVNVEILKIHDYEMPIFSDEREKQLGQPDLAKQFYKKIGEADAIIISFAEHNGTYTAAYKNLFDWTSRINSKVFQNKPMILLSTSPGAASVLKTATESAPFFGAEVKASISVPSFFDNYDLASGEINNIDIKKKLNHAIEQLIS